MVDPVASATATWTPQQPGARPARRGSDEQSSGGDPAAAKAANGRPLTRAQEREIRELQQRDRAVRAHEAAHQSAGAGTGGATFTYQAGPDGRQYAVGGEVQIDIGQERDPQATVTKMQRVIAAALAPADPSGQDQAVAARAREIQAQAEQQLAKERTSGAAKPAAAGGGDKAAAGYGGAPAATGSLFDAVA